METAWAADGNVILRSAQRPDYGVKVSGRVEGGPVQLRAIGYGQHGAERDVARDLDAQTLWCSDFGALSDQLARAGGEISVVIAKSAGQVPIEIVEETAPESRRETARRTPMRQAKR